MLTQPFAAHVCDQSSVKIVDLYGDLDALSETVLQAAYTEVVMHHPNCPILLNFSGVGYLHKSVIALLVKLAVHAREAQQPLMVCGLSEHYQQIFEITRLTDLIRHFPDKAQALAIGTLAPLPIDGLAGAFEPKPTLLKPQMPP